jgi:hypothetical protein
MSGREHHWRVGDREVSVRIEQSNEHGVFYMSGSAVPFRIAGPGILEVSGRRHRFYVLHSRSGATVWIDGQTYHLRRVTNEKDVSSAPHSGPGEVRSLMPGKLLRVMVQPGDVVTE